MDGSVRATFVYSQNCSQPTSFAGSAFPVLAGATESATRSEALLICIHAHLRLILTNTLRRLNPL
jgi:hypothetical protein